MRVFVNELSLAEACSEASPPHAPLEELLRIRHRSSVIRESLYCAGSLSRVEVRPGVTVEALARTLSRERMSLFLNWVNKRGPFIEHDRQVADDDLFYFESTEVTELGLGEAARRMLADQSTAVLSVPAIATSPFTRSPLQVLQGFRDDPIRHLDVSNYWDGSALEGVLRGEPREPNAWPELLDHCRSRYDRLLISAHCDAQLRPHPYQPSVGRAIERLLNTLQMLMLEMREDGSLTSRGQELRDQHFTGQEAPFSDESDRRKQARRSRFVFPDPAGGGVLECTWHGKIRTRYYRLYFEWPVPTPCRRMKICYIGPHL